MLIIWPPPRALWMELDSLLAPLSWFSILSLPSSQSCPLSLQLAHQTAVWFLAPPVLITLIFHPHWTIHLGGTAQPAGSSSRFLSFPSLVRMLLRFLHFCICIQLCRHFYSTYESYSAFFPSGSLMHVIKLHARSTQCFTANAAHSLSCPTIALCELGTGTYYP